MTARFLIVAVCIVASTPICLAQSKTTSEPVIARAGGVFITEKEFRDRFEMLPTLYRHRTSKLQEEKLELLYSIIAEKLLAQDAEARHFDTDSIYRVAMLDVRKALARDALYREEIVKKVTVTPAEIKIGIADAYRQLLVSYLYSENRDELEFLRKQIKSAADFDKLEIDSSMSITRDTATVIFGDADPAIEKAAYALKRGQVSPVIQSGDGFYVFTIEREQRSAYFLSLQPAVLHDRVESTLRERKERVRLNVFVSDFLKDKKGYSVPSSFKLLGRALEQEYLNQVPSDRLAITDAMGENLKKGLSKSLNDTISVIADTFWTIGQVIDRLQATGFTIDSAGIRRTGARLNTQLKVWVQQELLAREALRRGLDTAAGVKVQLDLWSSYYLSGLMKEYVRRQVNVPDSDVTAYMKTLKQSDSLEFVKIRELRTRSREDMQAALSALESGAAFPDVIQQYSNDPIAKRENGESEFFSVEDRQPVGQIAEKMAIGDRYGPLAVENGFLYFELVTKEIRLREKDTTTIEGARKTLLARRQKHLIDLVLAQSSKSLGYDIYGDRLKQLPVSNIPMMTFRVLGFGGRMLGVPFVEPSIDWIDMEPPKQKVIP